MADEDRIKSVLVIDDEHTVRNVLSEACRFDNVDIRTASRLETAELELDRRRFDLVIADVRLRGILETEGLELLSYIKRKWPKTKVLIMTSYGTDEAKREAFERGADYYYEKPLDIDEVRNIVQELRDVSRSLQRQ